MKTLDAWGKPVPPYTFRGARMGWACNYCGGLFRGLASLLEHQERKHTEKSEQEVVR